MTAQYSSKVSRSRKAKTEFLIQIRSKETSQLNTMSDCGLDARAGHGH